MAATPLIESIENRIILHFDSLESAMQLFSPWKGVHRRAEAVEQIGKALAAVGLNVEIRVKGRRFAELVSGRLRGPILTLLSGY